MNAKNFVLTPQCIEQIEKQHMEHGFSQLAMIELVAERCFQAILRVTKNKRKIKATNSKKIRSCIWLICCGKGNHGAEGWSIARKARQSGISCFVYSPFLLTNSHSEKLKKHAEYCGVTEIDKETFFEKLQFCDVLVDCLFGTKFTGLVSKELEAFIHQINCLAKKKSLQIFSINAPSGLCALTGKPSAATIEADHTLTISYYTPGLLTDTAIKYTGEIHLIDLGLDPKPTNHSELAICQLQTTSQPLRKLVQIEKNENKYSRGKLSLIVGSEEYPGAGLLAVAGCTKVIQCGYVQVFSNSQEQRQNLLVQQPELILKECSQKSFSELPNSSVTLVGCGKPPPSEDEIDDFFSHCGNAFLLIDAGWCQQNVLQQATKKAQHFLVLPHTGELQRIAPQIAQNLQSGKINKQTATKALAQQLGGFVLLKGPYSTISSPQGLAIQVPFANPYLAQAGSGDLLAGFLAAVIFHAVFKWQSDHKIREEFRENRNEFILKMIANGVYIHMAKGGIQNYLPHRRKVDTTPSFSLSNHLDQMRQFLHENQYAVHNVSSNRSTLP